MRLAVSLSACDGVELAREAERLGYDAVFVPEGFATEAVAFLGMLAGSTQRIGLVSGVFEIPARSPVMIAMTAATLDMLSHGRFRLGLGVASPYVSQGWHGASFGSPLARTREYVEIVRLALRREPVTYAGVHYRVEAPFRIVIPQVAPEIPVYLAAVGPRNLKLCGEIADGWFGVFRSPQDVADSLDHIRSGRGEAGLHGFDAALSVPLVLGDDLVEAADPVRRYVARFVGLGPRRENFYHALLTRVGLGDAADRIHERQQAGDVTAAAAAVPLSFVERIALVGPPERLAVRLAEYAEAGVTTLALSPMADALGKRKEALAAAAMACPDAIVLRDP
jgi:F420-dependent oxidoreductase-like protein